MAAGGADGTGPDGGRTAGVGSGADLDRAAGVRRGRPGTQRRARAAVTLPILLARRFPLTVLLVVLAAAAVDHLLGGNLGQPWFAMLLGVFALGAYGSAGSSAVGLSVLAGRC